MPWYLPTRLPILWEELRRRLRGGRGYIVLLAYGLVLMLLLLGATMLVQVGASPKEWPNFGRILWRIFLLGQLVAVILMSPALTASAISSERERGTLDLLFLTPMSTLTVVLGKYLGAIGQLLLVILSGVPIIAVVFSYGGVSPWEVVGGYALIIVTGIFYGTLGFLASCLCRRTTVAVAWAYGLMLIVLFVLPVAILLLAILSPILLGQDASSFWVILLANPLYLYLGVTGDENIGVQVTGAIVAMFIEAAVVLSASILLVRRLRETSGLFPRHISLQVARLNSRPPLAEQTAADLPR
ncbi:MAG: ABC transporter permease [Armatimonadota bacterium]